MTDERDEERREARRRYENDVFYEVYRAGGNPDRIDYERVDDRFYDGVYPEDAAAEELRRQQPHPAPDAEKEAP